MGLSSETGFGHRFGFGPLFGRSGKHFLCRNATVGQEAETAVRESGRGAGRM